MISRLKRVAGRYWWAALLCLVLGLSLGTSQWYRNHMERLYASWTSTTATVVDAEAYEYFSGTPSIGIDRRVYAAATLTYSVEGTAYEMTTDVYGLADWTHLNERLPAGATVWIRYAPDDPRRIYFDIGDVALVYSDLTWLVALLLAISAALIVFGRQT